MGSRKKRRPDLLIRILESDAEDELGDLFFGVEVLDIALDEKTLKGSFRSIVGRCLWKRGSRGAAMI